MSTTEAEVLVREIRIAARPQTVFPFLVDPVLMTRWMGVSATLDPRPGGIWRVDLNGSEIAAGAFLEIEPDVRVVFTFGWENEGYSVGPGGSTVTITLTPDGDATLLRLEHRGLPDADAVARHGEGWDWFLPKLVDVAV